MSEHKTTATGSADEAMALLRELRLEPMQGNVSVGKREWIVMIYARQKRPALKRYLGWPVRYHIGGGMPRAY